MSVLDRILRRPSVEVVERSDPPITFQQWVDIVMSFGGQNYPLGLQQTSPGQAQEKIAGSFTGLAEGAYKGNSVVFACMLVRFLLFSEARFQFRALVNGRPGKLFGTQSLSVLETPWEGGTTGDLLTQALVDADLAGNYFVTPTPAGLQRLQPDWVTIVLGSERRDALPGDLDMRLVGYSYQPGGPAAGRKSVLLLPEQVAHFAPIRDPRARYRGMSWLTPLIREIMSDNAMTDHKLRFMEHAATPNMTIALDPSVEEAAFNAFVDAFRRDHEGLENAYKTLFLGGGAKVDVVGSNFEQMDFKIVQGAGETRIAAAAGVPPVIVGLSEGLQAATYSNYGQARRRLADGTMRPLWRNVAGSFSRLVDVPASSQLWYDDRDIQFLREDEKDAAEIVQTKSQSIRTLVEAGFKADAAVEAVTGGDLASLIGQHTNLTSVQLQPPQTALPGANGNGQPNAPALMAASAREILALMLLESTEGA